MKHSVHIRQMEAKDIPTVCTIHRRVLPTAAARIGLPYLSRLYAELLRHPHMHPLLVAECDSAVVGCISATRDIRHTQKAQRTVILHPRALWSMFVALLQRQVTVAELADRFLTERDIRRLFLHPYQSILTFVVDTPWQHQGIGKRLLTALEKKLSSDTKLYVDTEITNSNAQRWYQRHGFVRLRTVRSNVIFGKEKPQPRNS